MTHLPRAFRRAIVLATLASLCIPSSLQAQSSSDERAERAKRNSIRSEQRGLEQPFKGITTHGETQKGLFPIKSTGVSTKPVRKAANAFLASLSKAQKEKTVFSVEDSEWRKWMNQHFYVRQGVGFDEMDSKQRDAAFALMGKALSAKGLKLSKDIMKLNHTLGEIKDNNFEEYNEWLYWITIMGEPSDTEPWGFQVDGHHLIINYFVLGDQVVMTPLFVGSEPVVATSGKYKGISILQEEQDKGLSFMQSLSASQQDKATLSKDKTRNNNLTEAFKDNVVLDYAGVKADNFSQSQKKDFLELIQLFIDNQAKGHADVRMEEIETHIDETYFAWVGPTKEGSVFYYRIQSPVILIEFDHQGPVGMRHLYPDRSPVHQHIHVVVRTPNGNDYGKDLLRQHHEHSH